MKTRRNAKAGMFASLALAGALAGIGTLGGIAVQMASPQGAAAKEYTTFVYNNKKATSNSYTAKIVGNRLMFTHLALPASLEGDRLFTLSSKCQYYKKAYKGRISKSAMQARLAKASKKQSGFNARQWQVNFSVKKGKVVKLAAMPY